MDDEHVAWLAEEFSRCSGWIQDALDRDIMQTHTLEDVWEELETGAAMLWPCANSVVVAKVEVYPRTKILWCWLVGGDLDEVLITDKSISEWAKKDGCEWVSAGGRRGWVRKLPGYTEAFTIVIKRL